MTKLVNNYMFRLFGFAQLCAVRSLFFIHCIPNFITQEASHYLASTEQTEQTMVGAHNKQTEHTIKP